MKAYWGFFRTRFRALIQYRVAALAGVSTQVLFGLVKVFVLCTFYGSSDAVQPLSLAQATTYVWIGQAMLRMLPWDLEPEIAASVRTGQVAYELSRPLDLYSMWFSRCLAFRTAPTLLRAIPQFALSLWVIPAPYGMLSPSAPAFLGWLAATFGALLLSCSLTSLLNASLLFTVTGDGVVKLAPTFVQIMSGMIIPLPLFPDWLRGFLKYQPFMGLVDGPARVFSGNMPLAELPELLLLQLIWAAAFAAAGRVLLKAGLKRVAVAGG